MLQISIQKCIVNIDYFPFKLSISILDTTTVEVTSLTILSSIITPDNLHYDLVSCFQSLYPVNSRFNLFILLFQKESLLLLCCFINQHHPMVSPCHAWFCPNTSFLQGSCFYLHSSLGYSFVLFSPMSNLGIYSLCLSSQPYNILLWHPSINVQHVLSLCGSILLIVFHLQSLH